MPRRKPPCSNARCPARNPGTTWPLRSPALTASCASGAAPSLLRAFSPGLESNPCVAAEPVIETVEPPPPAPEPPAPLATILVVEDEAGIRALVRKILRRQRYEVLEAANGQDALAL